MSEIEDRSAAHREGWDLMAWVVGGSATEAQRQTFEAHVRDCAACREEYEFQCRVRDALAQGWPEPAQPADAWARLSQRLDDEAASATGDEADRRAALSDGSARGSARGSAKAAQRRTPSTFWWRGLVAAVVVQAVGLAALGGAFWARGDQQAAYRTLSSAPANPAATIRLVPAPALKLVELQALLARHHLAIVESGPDGGHFGLVPVGTASGNGAERDRLLAELRNESGVLMAEPIGTAP